MEKKKPPLEVRQDSGISCFTPSPPPKKSSLPTKLSRDPHSMHREPRRRLPARAVQRTESTHETISSDESRVGLPPKLDLSSLTGSDSDSDVHSSGAASTDCSGRSEFSNPELVACASGTPASLGMSTPDGYQSDVESSSSSPATCMSVCPRSGAVGVGNLRRYGSDGLVDESEGKVMKVKLKMKSSNPGSIQEVKDTSSGVKISSHQSEVVDPFAKQTGSNPLVDSESALLKYAPLPGIGHSTTKPPETVAPSAGTDSRDAVSKGGQRTGEHHLQQDIREQRLKALQRSASHTEIGAKSRVPAPPPQSAKVVSRREMRMKQFARRKSASQAEALQRKSTMRASAESPQCGAEVESVKCVLLAVRLPGGARIQNLFKSSDTLRTVASFAMQSGRCSLELDCVCLVTNDMPKRVLTDLSVTIENAELKDRTLLHLEETD